MLSVVLTALLTILVPIHAVYGAHQDPELLAYEQRLEELKHAESRVLHQMKERLIENALVDEPEDVVAVLSRGRRTSDEKQRLCGRKIGDTVAKLCPSGCTNGGEFVPFAKAKRDQGGLVKRSEGIATYCCKTKCSFSEIKSHCCPNA